MLPIKRFLCALAVICCGWQTAQAQNFFNLYNFTASQGNTPDAGLTVEGNLFFGVTTKGGTHGFGNIYSINPDGSGYVDLHDFASGEANNCYESLTVSNSMIYGVGYFGGSSGNGCVFAVKIDGTGYTNLYSFTGGADGASPESPLLLVGNVLYGTTVGGGSGGNGTVFALNTDGTGFTTLFTFSGSNGSGPIGRLSFSQNTFYGATSSGGTRTNGTVFSLSLDGKTYNVLHNFTNADGYIPGSGLIQVGGTLYGTTQAGGGSNLGVVYAVGTNGTGFSVLHNFIGTTLDGSEPLAELLYMSNALYGTTFLGGSSSSGTIFSVSTNGTNFTLLQSFATTSGIGPNAPMIQLGPSMYGTTSVGGVSSKGTVFQNQITGVYVALEPGAQTNVPVNTSQTQFTYSGFSLSGPNLFLQWQINGVSIPGQTNYTLTFTNAQLTNGGNITVAVSDGGSEVTTTPAQFLVPAGTNITTNDNFANRYTFTGASGTINGNNNNATLEAGEPQILPGNPGGKSVWFQYHAATSGILQVYTTGSSFDTIMGVFDGSSIGTLVREPSAIADDDNGGYLTSKLMLNVVAGSNYDIGVDGYFGQAGTIVLTWKLQVGATLPVILSAPPPVIVVSNGATVSLVCRTTSGTPTWYFNGTNSGVVSGTNTISSVTATNVGIWTAQLTIGGSVLSTEPSVLEVNTLEDGSTDTNSVALNKFLNASTNTYFQTSLRAHRRQAGGDTRGYSVSQVFSTVGASGEAGEPAINGQIGGSPVWYIYVSPTNGTMTLNTAGSTFNTMLGVFVGPGKSFSTLTSIGGAYVTNHTLQGQPQVVITNMPLGQTNYILVDGYLGAAGTVNLNLSLGTPLTFSPPPASEYVVAGSNAVLSGVAVGTTPIFYQWQHAGTNLGWATNAQITITNAQTASTGTYTLIASNAISAITNTATLTLGTIPVFTTQPTNHTVHSGATGTVTAAATATPAPSFQWFFNNTNLGPTTTQWTIPNFSSANEGSYWVLASNVLGTTASVDAIVALDAPLRFGFEGFTNGSFDVQIYGAAGGTYILQSTTNLTNWVPMLTNTTVSGLINFVDTNASNFSSRYYRAITN